jgi:UDP-GlcNAc:undecaprenyl-phosphate GlcNAc-1-phosphate transferase
VNLIDGMDALAAGIVGIAAASFAVLAMSFGRVEAAALAGDRLRRDARLPVAQLPPGQGLHGRQRGADARLRARGARGRGRAQDAGDDRARRAAADHGRADPRHVVRRRQAAEVPPPPWAADHNHFYHRFLRIGLSQRKTAAYLHLWAAVLAGYAMLLRFVPPRPARHWDALNAADLRRRRASSSSPARCGWSTSSRSSRPATSRSSACGRLPRDVTEPEQAVEELLEAGEPTVGARD